MGKVFSKKFTKLDWLHVLRELNTEVDKRANMVMEKKGGGGGGGGRGGGLYLSNSSYEPPIP
jgi:hypothetical protein